MTVKEVIEALEEFDENMDVKIFCGTTNEIAVGVIEDIEDGCPVVSV